MEFVKHQSNNFLFKAPEEMRGTCSDLPVTMCQINGVAAVKSFWQPSEVDIANILAGGQICLYVVGTAMPPVCVTVEG